MSGEPWRTIESNDSSLASKLQALDALSARLSTLTTRTKWPVRVPLNSKASISGQIVHTNDLKVDVGEGYWIEMTADEARGYVQRRKTDLLLRHAGLRENTSTSTGRRLPQPTADGSQKVEFDSLFSMPAAAGPSRPRLPTPSLAPKPMARAEPSGTTEPSPVVARPTLGNRNAASTTAKPATLEDVVEQFLEAQKELAGSSRQKARLQSNSADDGLVNEEGLPIREIKEDMNGQLIGDAPEPTGDGEASLEYEDNDYWSEEAQARRAALRRKLFSEDTSDDSDDEEAVEANETTQAKPAVNDTAVEEPEEDAESRPSSPPPRRSSSSAPPPARSILKQTPARKKSVTFDESIPLPPDSPPSGSVSAKMGFPMPTAQPVPSGEFDPRPVPVIAAPKPAAKSTNSGGYFAGFKRGFLDGQPSTPPVTASSSPSPTAKPSSLFAQRLAAQKQPGVQSIFNEDEEDQEQEQDPEPVKGTVIEKPTRAMSGLPKFSETKPMSSMKNAVVEKVIEKPTTLSPPVAGPSRPSPLKEEIEYDEEEGGVSDEEEDFYDDEEEEEEDDEFDFDEAMLAREAALEYHRKQGYLSHAARGIDPDNEDLEDGQGVMGEDGIGTLDEDGQGGVLMGIPQIDADGKIINPTPDDFRKFVRVGRLENGNLVLAPGEEGWSDDEDEAKKARREQVKRQLLGLGDMTSKSEADTSEQNGTSAPESSRQQEMMPPAVTTGPVGEVKEKATERVESPADPPKKVSRFKAARMGMS